MDESVRARTPISACAAGVLFLVLCACVGTPVPVVVTPPQDEATQLTTKAIALVGGPVPELALDLYNKNLDRFPEVAATILSKYTEREKALFERYKGSGDVSRLAVYSRTCARCMPKTTPAPPP
jgi:hypothetical protein